MSWTQVREFREDREARQKYRDFHMWVDDALKGLSERQVVDRIGQKLDDYEWAIRKHGLRTKLDGLSTIVKALSVALPTSGLLAGVLALEPRSGMMVGASLAIAGSVASIGTRLLDLHDERRVAAREVAYLYDLKHLKSE